MKITTLIKSDIFMPAKRSLGVSNMKITALVENVSNGRLQAKHGLCLYIETAEHKILFDLGPDETLLHNAQLLGIDLGAVDIAIISHGHRDHGGGLEAFLSVNSTAVVYAQRKAFDKLYCRMLHETVSVGLDEKLKNHPQLRLLDGNFQIDEQLSLFTVAEHSKCRLTANDVLFNEYGQDDFAHEQNLLIKGRRNVLIMGCGHCGVVNVLQAAASEKISLCIGGFHLLNPVSGETVSKELLDEIAAELNRFDCGFFTCHCTGEQAFEYLRKRLPQLHYLNCGEKVFV